MSECKTRQTSMQHSSRSTVEAADSDSDVEFLGYNQGTAKSSSTKRRSRESSPQLYKQALGTASHLLPPASEKLSDTPRAVEQAEFTTNSSAAKQVSMKLPKKTKPNSTFRFRRSKDTEMNNAYGFYGFRSSKKKADPTSIGAEFYSVGEFQASLRNWWKEKYTASPGCRFSSVVRYRICQSMTASCESMEGCNFNVRIELTIQGLAYKVTESTAEHSQDCHVKHRKQAKPKLAKEPSKLATVTRSPKVGTMYKTFEDLKASVKDWHEDQYPGRNITVRERKYPTGRPLVKCSLRDRDLVVCDFRVVAKCLGEGKGYKVVQADLKHSVECNRKAKGKGRALNNLIQERSVDKGKNVENATRARPADNRYTNETAATPAASSSSTTSDRLVDLGVTAELCGRFSLHGINTIAQFKQLGVREGDFKSLCKFVKEQDPDHNGDTQALETYLLQRRIYHASS